MASVKSKSNSRGRQALLAIILSILAIGAYAYIVITYFNSVAVHIERIAESALTGTSKEIDNWVKQKEQTIDLISKNIKYYPDDPEQLLKLLMSIKADDGDYIDIFFGSAASPGAGGYAVYATNWTVPEDYDWTSRTWFITALEYGNTVITPPYVDLQTGKTIISISKPVYVDGILYGVISSDISTDIISEIIETTYAAEGSIIRLFNGQGDSINRSIVSGENSYLDISDKKYNDVFKGSFLIETDALSDRYTAYIGLTKLGWILSIEGSLSSFEDVSRTVLLFLIILFSLAALFIFMLIRSMRAAGKLSVVNEQVEQINRTLEETVAERTSSLKNILDSAEEGFLTFGENFQVNPDYSKGCTDIFGKEIKDLSVADLLFAGQTEIISDFKQGFGLYFQGKSKAEIIFDLTEKETDVLGKNIRISYKEIAGNKILCILQDITLEKQVAEKNRSEAERQNRILRAIHNKYFFAHFLESANNLFAYLEVYSSNLPVEEEKVNLMRILHTFKGDSGYFGFTDTQSFAHESETMISDSMLIETKISYKEILIQLRKSYFKELKSITDTMGDAWIEESNGIIIPRQEFQKLYAYVLKKVSKDKKLAMFLDSFRKITLAELFSRLPFIAAVSAEKLGKRINPMVIQGGNFKIVPDHYLSLVESCSHIINNMLDHGIEYPYERESLQKTPEGSIILNITVNKKSISLEFSDDGRGINTRIIEKKAKDSGLIAQDQTLHTSELYSLLFADGFSTRQDVDITSGRGVGLASVKQEVDKLGGSIEVSSKIGKGSTFEIIIPITNRV